jgi:hypothetical protein
MRRSAKGLRRIRACSAAGWKWLGCGLIIAVLALPAAAAAATPCDFVGMYASNVIGRGEPLQTDNLRLIGQQGVRILRAQFDWNRIETSPGHFDLRYYDRLVAEAAASGLRVLPILLAPPGWWSTAPAAGPGHLMYPPNDDAAFGRFAATLVHRYGPGGTLWQDAPWLPKLPIVSWQIWNEPSLWAWWATGPDPARYTALLKAAHAAIKAADPSAEVVAAGLPLTPLGMPLGKFVNGMYAAGAKGNFDTFALHAYASTASESIRVASYARDLLDAHGDPAPVWITEVGWASGGPSSFLTLDEPGQAQTISDFLDQVARQRVALGLRGVIYFQWKDVDPATTDWDIWIGHLGLLRTDGSAKPSLSAFTRTVAADFPPCPPTALDAGRRAPKFVLSGPRRQSLRRRRIRAYGWSDRPVSVSAGAFARTGSRTLWLSRTARRLAPGVKTRLTLRVPRRQLSVLRRSLKRHRRVKLRIAARAVDATGSAAVARLTVRLYR